MKTKFKHILKQYFPKCKIPGNLNEEFAGKNIYIKKYIYQIRINLIISYHIRQILEELSK